MSVTPVSEPEVAAAPPVAGPRPTEPSPRWEGKRRGGKLGNRFFLRLATSRPGRACTPFFLFWVVLYFLVAAPAGRRASFDLARRVGRGRTAWQRLRFAFGHYYTYGAMLIERMSLLGAGEELFQIEKFGEEGIREAVEAGAGALLFTSHVGSWETMAQCLSCIEAQVTLVMYDGVQPQVKAALEELSAKRSFDVLYTDGGPTSAAGILAALSRGHIVGMMADRTLAGRGVTLPFLGGEAVFPVGPYSIAAASGAPAFQVFAMRRAPYEYQFHAFPFGKLAYENRRNKNADFERWGRAFATRLEEFTRAWPQQWGNLYDFWKEPYGG